jgi:hypothetical protein
MFTKHVTFLDTSVFRYNRQKSVSYTVKKVNIFPVPSQDINNNLVIPSRESFVSDIPAGDGKITNLFPVYDSCMNTFNTSTSYVCCNHKSGEICIL